MHIRLRPKELVRNEKVNSYNRIRHARLHPKITNEQYKENTKYNYKHANQAPPETISMRPKKQHIAGIAHTYTYLLLLLLLLRHVANTASIR